MRWTRTESLTSMSALDNFLTATATYESWDFRWAYVVRYAEDYRLSVDQTHALLQSSLAETTSIINFTWRCMRSAGPGPISPPTTLPGSCA
jgi:hypothetical protein